jgi:CubicO group peptidase (beta-lactamase class C family)
MPTRKSLDTQLQAALGEARERQKVPGAAVGVLLDGRETVAVSGVTSVDNPLDVTEHTLFMIGSTSKTFTATALMALVEKRMLSLDHRVVDHLPDFRLRSRHATQSLRIKHLLTHTGGWDGDIEGNGSWGEDALAGFVRALRKQPQQTPVGTVWAYNNSGFAVAGRIIEVLTGLSFDAAVRKLVLQPAGLDETFYLPTEVVSRRFAVGHISSDDGPKVAHAWGIDRAGAPAGGVVSSAHDQLRYARLHMGDGTGDGGRRVLRQATLRRMQAPQFPAGNFADHVGLSWMIRDIAGVRTVNHGGNVSNLQLSTFMMIPERGFALTVLTNSGSGAALGAEIERWVLERYMTLAPTPPATVTLPATQLRAYAGRYESKLLVADITANGTALVLTSRFNISVDDVPEEERELVRQLLKARPKPVTLAPIGDDRVVADGGSRGEFLRPHPGTPVRWFRWGGRLLTRTRSR